MYCPQCGSSQSDSASNCSNCKLALNKSTPTAPYFERVESNFHSAAILIFLFPLVGLLARTQIDNGIVQIGGIVIAIVCPLIGIGNMVVSAAADTARADNNLPAANAKAQLAGKLKMGGYAFGFPILLIMVGFAFVTNFLGSGGHGGGEAEQAPEMAETAPAEAPPEGDKAVEGAKEEPKKEAGKEEAKKEEK